MAVVWHPTKWCDCCMPEDEQKKQNKKNPFFIEEKQFKQFFL